MWSKTRHPNPSTALKVGPEAPFQIVVVELSLPRVLLDASQN